jgi:hypothetical protein
VLCTACFLEFKRIIFDLLNHLQGASIMLQAFERQYTVGTVIPFDEQGFVVVNTRGPKGPGGTQFILENSLFTQGMRLGDVLREGDVLRVKAQQNGNGATLFGRVEIYRSDFLMGLASYDKSFLGFSNERPANTLYALNS